MKLYRTGLIAFYGFCRIASAALAVETAPANHWTLQDVDAVADAYAKANGMKRSELFAMSVREKIGA